MRDRPAYYGLHFDAAGIHVGNSDLPSGPITETARGALPPSVLWEPLTESWTAADGVDSEPHATSLLGLFPDAIDAEQESGTLPGGRYDLATAWRTLGGEPNLNRRPVLEREGAAGAIEALGRKVQQTLQTEQGGTVAAALVIPNWFDEAAQDAVLESLRAVPGLGDNLRLLWRPIAAAIAWCDRFGADLLRECDIVDQPIGSLLALHLGIDEFEAVRIQLIPQWHQGRLLLLPSRDRANVEATTQVRKESRKSAAHLLGFLAETSFGVSSGRTSRPDAPPSVDRLALLSPWLGNLLHHVDGADRLLDPEARLRLTLASGGRTPVTPWPPSATRLAEDADDWLTKSRKWVTEARGLLGQSARPWLGAVVSGPLASVPHRASVLAETLAQELAPGSTVRVLRSDPYKTAGDPVAGGAALFAARAELDQATYLDTLPELRLLTSVKGESVWSDLLPEKVGDAPVYVPGAKEWERTPELTGFSIERDRGSIEFNLHMGGHPTVKVATAKLGKAVTTRVPVSLNIRMRPASGFAKVQIKPVSPRALSDTQPIMLDFRRMEDTGETPEQVVGRQPRSFPDIEPRPASPNRWQEVRRLVDDGVRTDLRAIREALLMKDSDFALGATAVSSNGELPMRWKNDQHALRSIVNKAKFAISRNSTNGDAIAVLGYSSTDDPDFLRMLRKALKDGGTRQLEVHEWIAVGGCLRDPKSIAAALAVIDHHLSSGMAPMHPLRALAQLLRYRHDALELTDSSLCESLAGSLVSTLEERFNDAMQKSSELFSTPVLAFIFREALRSFFFLLRRRRFDDSFLDPEGKTATRAIRLLDRARNATRDGIVTYIGGAVNLDAVWDGITAHIQKRGVIPVRLSDD